MHSTTKAVRALALAGVGLIAFTAAAKAGAAGTIENAEVVTATGQIEQVLITGFLEQDLPQMLANLGTRVDTVTAVEIKNGGYLDVAQALQATAPGLYISPLRGPFDYVDASLLGSRTQDILWTVDGVRINNRLYSFTTPLDTIPASMVERIEIIEGPQAIFYGTQALAGAINIVTKEFSETPDGQFSVAGDSNSGRHLDGYFRDTIGMSHFVVYGSADNSEGYSPFRDSDYQPSQTDRNRGYEVLTIGGKYGIDFNDAVRFTISEQHTDADLDYLYGPQGIRRATNERNEDILSAKLDYTASDRLQFFVKGYYHWWYAYYTEFNNEIDSTGAVTGNVTVANDHDFWGFTDYGVNAMAKFSPNAQFDTYLGYDFQAYSGNDVVLFIEEKTENVHAVFGEIATTKAFLANAQFAAGFRYNEPSVAPSATVWNVTGRWDVVPGQLYIKGMVGTAFRAPTAEELFANDPGFERGNPDLKPEESTNVNASIGGQLMNRIRWEAVGFYREIENLIDYDVFDSSTGQDVFGNVAGKVTTKGGLIALTAELTDDISGSASFTVSETRNSSTDLQINRVPEQVAKLLIDYHPMGRMFGLFGSINYIGNLYDTPGGTRTNYGNYTVVDIGGRVFFDSMRHHRFDIGVRNLFDETYSTRLTRGFPDNGGPAYIVGNLGLPRTFHAAYTYSFF